MVQFEQRKSGNQQVAVSIDNGTRVITRLQSDTLHLIDAFISREADQPSRSEAIRRLVEKGLKAR